MDGINLVCNFTGDFGLGVYSRIIAKLIRRKNIPLNIMNLPLPGRDAPIDDYKDYIPFMSNSPRYDTNLFVFGADLAKILPHIANYVNLNNKFNVYIPFWELYEFSDDFIQLKDVMDVFIAPTNFIKYSMMRVMDNTHIEYLPPFVTIPQQLGKVEKHNRFRFYYNFDIGSSISRKNPNPLIKVFGETFYNDESVELVLKLSRPASPDQKQELMTHGNNTNNITIHDTFLPYSKNIDLVNSTDCYVSTHRSEGLGMGMYEAMLLKKPVIATAFGGNVDFMDNSCSIMVPYTKVPVECPLYKSICNKTDTWAEINQDELKKSMMLIRSNNSMRNVLGKNGYDKVKEIEKQFWNTNVFESIRKIQSRK
jgi:glycosyltransferase involved in cell wall biosynthesis